MSEKVSHKGKVIKVTSASVTVEIISQSACSSCHAAGLCTMSEAVRKEVEVPCSPGECFHEGETVDVVLSADMGMKAVALAYVGPLLLMLAVCMALSFAGVRELYSGLAGLAAVAVYYLLLYLVRDRMAKKYVFRIVKENNLNS